MGAGNGGAAYLEVDGGTLDFGTVNDRGITIVPNNTSARAVVTISSGKLRTNWIDAVGKNNVECRFVQTGGEVETGAMNNGNLWLVHVPEGIRRSVADCYGCADADEPAERLGGVCFRQWNRSNQKARLLHLH